MDRLPLSRGELDQLLAEGLADADDSVCAAWDCIKIPPERWRCSPWGDEGGGFWVVAVRGDTVIWFNDIEDGFNTSTFSERGVIAEYGCAQSTFSDVLSSLPEAVVARAFARQAPASSVPPTANGPGRIVQRQTSSWVIQPATGASLRVHFSGWRESRFVGPEYESVALRDAHPVLLEHVEDWSSVFVAGRSPAESSIVEQLVRSVEAATEGWRGFAAYAGRAQVHEVLQRGHGLVMRAPAGVARRAAEVFAAAGVTPSVVGAWKERGDGQRPLALVLGANFVIADAFRFERLSRP